MIDDQLDWRDIFYHAAAGAGIGAIAGAFSHLIINVNGVDVNIGFFIVCLNTIGWPFREFIQKPNYDRIWKSRQVIYEYVFPMVSGWLGFLVVKEIIERYLL